MNLFFFEGVEQGRQIKFPNAELWTTKNRSILNGCLILQIFDLLLYWKLYFIFVHYCMDYWKNENTTNYGYKGCYTKVYLRAGTTSSAALLVISGLHYSSSSEARATRHRLLLEDSPSKLYDLRNRVVIDDIEWDNVQIVDRSSPSMRTSYGILTDREFRMWICRS